MSNLEILKYFFRFVILQTVITFITIWYFDKFLIGDYKFGYEIIINNLYEDRIRFFEFIPREFIKIDIYLAIFVFLFLLLLYSSNFYSYVNELNFSVNKNLLDEFIPIYLIWTASFLSFLQIFRFTAVSRLYLILFTIIVPLILVIFRNSEAVSSILGRNPSKENYILINVDKDSIFRELRIIKLRTKIKEFDNVDISNTNLVENLIKDTNKASQINLIVINVEDTKTISNDLEQYLINMNKKILLVTNKSFSFNSKIIFRKKDFGDKNLIYINNDIQYGSNYILKRFVDIILTLLFMPILLLIIIPSYFYVILSSGRPVFIKQTRVGLHGDVFNMYKLRTMDNNSHIQRKELTELNKKSGPLFKIDNDPRLIKGAQFFRKYSIDELPQFLNVLKGDMSIVGPRPLFPEDNQYFDKHYLRRLNVMPGITGLLQINERNTDDFDIWYRYDIEYIENWSISKDIEIILKTPFSLIRSKTSGK